MQSEFNAKAQSCQDAKLGQKHFNEVVGSRHTLNSVVMQDYNHIQSLCVFAPLRLCVKSFPHRSS